MHKKYSCYIMVLCGMITVLVLIAELLENIQEMPGGRMIFTGVETASEPLVNRGYVRNLEEITGNERTIQCSLMDQNYRIDLDDREMEVLCRIVQAEAGGEDRMGKILVADVIINRVLSPNFPDDVEEVVFQYSNGVYQFSPVRNGRYYDVEITEETREAVLCALREEDASGGALYFASRQYASPDKMSWFDDHLTCVEKHGGHEFFR